MPESVITKNELATKLGVHINTIDKWRKEGMPAYKLGKPVRFDYEAVLKWATARGKM